MMMTIKEAKAKARILKTFMAEQGTSHAHGVYLEAVARMANYKNWATYLAAANAVEALVKTFDDVASWPAYVFFYDEQEETNFAEKLYVLPLGITLADRSRQLSYGPFDTRGAREVPEGFRLSDKTVATKVYSTAPSVDKYGLPHYADEDKASEFFREDLHCAAISAMDVSFTDTNDDSSSRYWFEARVHPEVAKTLNTHFMLEAQASVTDGTSSASMTEDERIEAAYSSAFADVFTDVAGQSVKRVMDCLSAGAKAKDIAATAWLRMRLGVNVVPLEQYEHLNCRRLTTVLRKKAMLVYDDMLLRALKQ